MNKKKHECPKCFRDDFKSARGLAIHDTKAHPYVPPPAPKQETVYATDEEVVQTLVGGRDLEIGDVVWLGRKSVITKITKTEGSRDVNVTLRITSKWYSTREPITT